VAIDSVNPSLVPGAAGEAEVASAVEAALRAIGIDVQASEAAPGRPNVVGVLEGRRPGPSLMLCGSIRWYATAGCTGAARRT
jgi:acetylornithine deacetylase